LRRIAPLVALTASAALLPAAGPPRPAPALELVPPGAWMFAHLRAGDFWNGPLGREVRETIGKNNPTTLSRLDRYFGVPPETIASVTAVWPRTDGDHIAESFALVVNLAKPAAGKDVLAVLTEEARRPDGSYRLKGTDDGSLFLASDRRLVLFSDARARNALFDLILQRGVDGALGEALAAAAGHDLVIGLRPAVFQPGPGRRRSPGPEEETILSLLEAESATIVADFGPTVRVQASARYAGSVAAEKAERAVRWQLRYYRSGLKMYRSASVDAALEAAQVERAGATVRVSVEVPAVPMLAGIIGRLPSERVPVARMKSANNLKQIALAMHNYESMYQRFPQAAVCDKQGKPLLSWRVTILPFVEQGELYKQFKLDEPWDSDHNRKLLPKMPEVYWLPGGATRESATTHYRVFIGTGPGGASGLFRPGFELRHGYRMADIQAGDGMSNTIMVVEAGEAVPWTKPDELPYHPEKPLPKFAEVHDGGFNAVFFDGSVRFIKNSAPEKPLRYAIMRNDGQVFNMDDLIRDP
jgi:prepilin-type processing-associated H-X9-DG protein